MAKNIPAITLAALLAAAPAAAASDGYRLYLDGRLTDSARAYQDAFLADPSSVRPLLDAAMVFKQMGKGLRAAELLEKASLKEPRNPDILCETGWLYFHEAGYGKADLFFEKALTLDRGHARAVLGRASVLAHLGDRAGTMRLLARYKELRPDFSGVDYIIAWNYVNFQMYREAEEKLIEVLRQDPSFVEARLPLAGIYARQKKFDEAWNQYYRVLDYAPGHPVAAENIKVLEGRLTKQPEDIRPPFRITSPTRVGFVDAVQALEKSVKLKVGVGTDNTGKQARNNILKLRSFEGFTIRGRSSGRLYATVPAGESWTAVFEKDRVVIKNAGGEVYGRFQGALMLESLDARTGSVIIEAVKTSKNPYFRHSDRQYRGALELYPMPGRGIGVRNHIDMELYLLGVVPAEVSPQWAYESLKAQAVIARTQAVLRSRSGPHKADGYHICDSQHCQVYRGVGHEANSTNKAVLETESEILTHKGKPAWTFYHSNCGGHTQSSGEVTGWGKLPYLNGRPDRGPETETAPRGPWDFHLWITGAPPANCNYPEAVRSSEYRWLRILKHKDIEFRVNRNYGTGALKEIVPLRRAASGNVNSIRFVGSKKTVDIDREHLIRNILGFGSLKSTLFSMETNRFPDGRVRNYWLYGGGWGHGIGLCQSGAAGMAGKYGKKYREILDFYFPGTAVSRLRYVKKD